MSAATAFESCQTLPIQERVEVMFQLWDNLIDEGWIPEPDSELDAELERRLARHDANPADTRTWEQIMERLGNPR